MRLLANAGTASASIVHLLQTVGWMLTVIGGVAALLSFGIGALLIMGSGGHADRAAKGMKAVKNAVIGIAILAMGVFERTVVTGLVNSTQPLAATHGKHPAHDAAKPAVHHPVHLPWTWIAVGAIGLVAATGLGKVARALYRRRIRRIQQHEAREAWASLIGTPGEDGPVEPEEGYEIIAAEKHEHLDETDKKITVNFHVGRYRFDSHHHWQRQGLADDAISYDGARSFDLDDDAVLASAWFDFSEACAEVNRKAWEVRVDAETSARAAEEVAEDELHDEAVELETQRAALQALPGPTFTSDAVDQVLAEAKQKTKQNAGA